MSESLWWSWAATLLAKSRHGVVHGHHVGVECWHLDGGGEGTRRMRELSMCIENL